MENRRWMEFAEDVARGAGEILRRNHGRRQSIRYKGEINLVTEVDCESEAYIIDRIRRAYPDHGILSEESDELLSPAPFRWIVDPIDGTYNAAMGVPFYSVSLAVATHSLRDVEMALVQNIVTGDLYFAEKGKGARMVAKGATTRTGEIPTNNFGGLKARGNPIAATGLYQIGETVIQLRGKAGANQVPDAKVGMAQSMADKVQISSQYPTGVLKSGKTMMNISRTTSRNILALPILVALLSPEWYFPPPRLTVYQEIDCETASTVAKKIAAIMK